MNLDRELLRRSYLKNGYADARVTAAQADLDRDGSGFVITFAVEEGVQYNFGAVAVENGSARPQRGLAQRRGHHVPGRHLQRPSCR